MSTLLIPVKYGTQGTHNWNIGSIAPLPSPAELKRELPLAEETWEIVYNGRLTIPKILLGEDPRLLVIVGPCSIHNVKETEVYADRLASLREELLDQLFIVMRVCCDKPRSRFGWTGFFNDPNMDGSGDIAKGWRLGRKLLLDILAKGLPIAAEFLDPDNCQNVDDLLAYNWIGARNVQVQMHRQIASGLSTAVGFKNPNLGGAGQTLNTAIDAIDFARHSNVFVASNDNGQRSRFSTQGNIWGHLILRGTDAGPNCDPATIEAAARELFERGLISRIVVDISHGNSQKKYRRQREVIELLFEEMRKGSRHIAGIMYESYLDEGNQPIPIDLSELKPNISVTDGCDSFHDTEVVLRKLHSDLRTLHSKKRQRP